jgi:hypothetical protein
VRYIRNSGETKRMCTMRSPRAAHRTYSNPRLDCSHEKNDPLADAAQASLLRDAFGLNYHSLNKTSVNRQLHLQVS